MENLEVRKFNNLTHESLFKLLTSNLNPQIWTLYSKWLSFYSNTHIDTKNSLMENVTKW